MSTAGLALRLFVLVLVPVALLAPPGSAGVEQTNCRDYAYGHLAPREYINTCEEDWCSHGCELTTHWTMVTVRALGLSLGERVTGHVQGLQFVLTGLRSEVTVYAGGTDLCIIPVGLLGERLAETVEFTVVEHHRSW